MVVRQVGSGLECDKQWFRFDELGLRARGTAAARRASNTDILVLAVGNDGMLPDHVQFWLGLSVGLRDQHLAGALVAVIGMGTETTKTRPLFLEYLEAVAATGGLEFFPLRGGVSHRVGRCAQP